MYHWSRFMVNWSRGRMVNRCRIGSMVNGFMYHWSRFMVNWSRVDRSRSRFDNRLMDHGCGFVHWGGWWVIDRLRSMVDWGRVHDWLVNHRCMVSWCWFVHGRMGGMPIIVNVCHKTSVASAVSMVGHCLEAAIRESNGIRA